MKPHGYLLASAALSACLMAGAATAANLDPLVTKLRAQGWTVIEEADGNRRLYPPGAAVETLSTAPAEPIPTRPSQEELIGALTDAGWKLEDHPDGSQIIRPPSLSETSRKRPRAAPARGSGMLKNTTLAILELEALGWRVDKAEDSSILLYPPVKEIEAVPEPASEAEAEIPASPRMLDAATLEQMRALGWEVEYATDGSVLLYPPGPPVEPVTQEAAPTAQPVVTAEPAPPISQEPASADQEPAKTETAAQPQTAAVSDDDQFDILREKGWTVERKADGSLLLFPPGYTGPVPSVVADGTVELPVNTWSEVHAVANAWLTETGKTGLKPGNVRKVFGVYIVSIVGAAPPHALTHQLSVRTSDGTVIQLD